MLVRLSVFAAGIALAALTIPELTARYLERSRDAGPATEAQPAQVAKAKYAGGRDVTLAAGNGGHFYGTFTINGRRQEGMVDTGASVIALNLSTVRRLGISATKLNFNAPVRTANGTVRAAYVMLDRVEIGTISVRNVEAAVLPDASLSGMLVGMSFLNKLSSFRVEDGALHLVR